MEIVQNPSPTLPEEMIFEVLMRVTYETLKQCRLTCKRWNHLTYGSTFIHLHCQRTGMVNGYFIQAFEKYRKNSVFICQDSSLLVHESPSLGFLPERVKIEAISNEGLVYCVSSGYNGVKPRYYVCKPTTKEWVKMPNPKTKFLTYKTAMILLQSKPLHYKIVRFSEPQYRQSRRYFIILCEIFDSASGDWKWAKDIKLAMPDFLNDGVAVYAKGAIHWLTNCGKILAFDVRSEKWKLISLPKQLVDDNYESCSKKLVQHEGKLAILYEKGVKLEIWVMENYFREAWKIEEVVVNSYGSVIDLFANDVALVLGYDTVTWYNFHGGNSTKCKVHRYFYPHNVFPFYSDFEPVFLSG
ncbi:hypothetical protein GH714_019161 [Hevea brasiliensis]|uniref:F-box domain-containing protein n=1 Tax=Hevea brasiliensis TaxID=3981 RepID=A0A6A6LHR6_HEVBR|nr:hypothetical protein GH714_019161 [Hevea brasiliensis]